MPVSEQENAGMNDEIESVEPMSDTPKYREWAKETIQEYRATKSEAGKLIGERIDHRSWLPDIFRRFLNAPVIKPPLGEIARKLYG